MVTQWRCPALEELEEPVPELEADAERAFDETWERFGSKRLALQCAQDGLFLVPEVTGEQQENLSAVTAFTAQLKDELGIAE